MIPEDLTPPPVDGIVPDPRTPLSPPAPSTRPGLLSDLPRPSARHDPPKGGSRAGDLRVPWPLRSTVTGTSLDCGPAATRRGRYILAQRTHRAEELGAAWRVSISSGCGSQRPCPRSVARAASRCTTGTPI
uniref:Uncharacterized protein n=1 Tax=Salinispora arenicola (strain CNS-205) TaxID=391037 RepID=A8LXH0_SALAI